MNDPSQRLRQKVEAQVERWTTEAKKLAEKGNESAALELYRQAADELPGAPWLQHRTAELARKLKKKDVAIVYFRRAATAFQIADFSKRAVAPLRTAWSLSLEGLPGTSKLVVELAVELMQLHRKLGFAADATVIYERSNAVLRSCGFSELPPHVLESQPPAPAAEVRAISQPPSSLPPSSRPNRDGASSTIPPASDVVGRGSGAPPVDGSPRARAFARMLGRRPM